MEWAGQYDQLKDEQKRLTMIVPVSLVFILFLLYTTFNSLKNALLVLVTVPFALIGGIFSLVLTGTNFSISAAVGVISTLGVAILGGVLLISRIEDFRRSGVDHYGKPSSKARMCRCVPFSWRRWPPPSDCSRPPWRPGSDRKPKSLLRAWWWGEC